MMGLCEICNKIDFSSVLVACLEQCRERQDAFYGDGDGVLSRPDDLLWIKQHEDIFDVKEMARDCELCRIIFDAFEQRNVANEEYARDLPIGFRPYQNNIEVCYNTKEGLIKICTLNFYMNAADVMECFRVYEIMEDDKPPILKMIEEDPDAETSTTVAASWLRNCLENHESCARLSSCQYVPKRLINVGNHTKNPYLVDTSPGLQTKWLSLSYCWGGEPTMKLTQDTTSMLRNGIPLEKLDPTIREAIIVARALKFLYIWIDSLCIVQDPESNDWNKQAPKMNEIYGGSVLTLITASSPSVMDGFLKKRRLQYIPVSSFNYPDRENSGSSFSLRLFLSLEWDETEDLANGPWSSRGWTMQEGLLPSRLLYYTSSQMIWKCCEEVRFERGVIKRVDDVLTRASRSSDDLSFTSGWFWELETFQIFKGFPHYLPSRMGTSILSEPETYRLWYDLVEEYSPRKFKDIGDRLVALSGLARAYGNMIQCNEYIVGLWKPDLVRGLMWYTKGATLIPRHSQVNMRGVNSSLPTWSWACVGYELVKHCRKYDNHVRCLSQIEKIEIDLVDHKQPFGAVRSGRITLAGPLLKVPVLYNKTWGTSGKPTSELERHIFEVVQSESLGGVDPKYSAPPGGHFAIVKMLEDSYSVDLLVLEATGEVSSKIHLYRRVGILTLSHYRKVSPASPELIAIRKRTKDSLKSCLGPQREPPRRNRLSARLEAELCDSSWRTASVIII